MKLRVLGSGSSGNCYLLETDNEVLIIEAGVKIQKLKVALDFDFKKVVGCIITHEHGDHAKEIKAFQSHGINCFMSAGTAKATDSRPHRTHRIKHGFTYQIGNFKILPFDVEHDAIEPLGFLLFHPDCGKVLFLTDSKYTKHTFKGLNNIIIEANYSQEIIDSKYTKENGLQFLRNRIIDSHFSIDNCIELLRANDLAQVNNIVLIHLSDSNSHEINFKKQIEELTAKTVTTADTGTEIEFNKTPF